MKEEKMNLPPHNHNNPPSDLSKESLELKHLVLVKEADAHAEFVKNIPPVFTQDIEASFTADFIKRVKACQNTMETTRKEEKQPYWNAGQLIDAFFNAEKERLETVINTAMIPLNAYLQEKARAEKTARDAEAEAMRKEQQAAIADAAAMGTKPTTQEEAAKIIEHASDMATVAAVATQRAAVPLEAMASASGKFSKAGLQKKIVGKVINKAELDLNKLRPYITDAALQVALNAFIKFGGRECAGAEIKEETVTAVK